MEKKCCVCHQTVRGSAYRLGSRVFCEQHYHSAYKNRDSVWKTTLFGIISSVAFVVFCVVLADRVSGMAEGVPAWVGIVVVLIPVMLWLLVFYRLDSVEPEPKAYVFGMIALGFLAAGGVGIRFTQDILNVNTWMFRHGVLPAMAVSVLLVGVVAEFLKYAVVRYTVFLSAEFDERADGVIYGAAAGLGYALMMNLQFVLSYTVIDIGTVSMRVVMTTLVHACFGGVSGFFLAVTKFEEKPVWWLPLGVGIASLLNGSVYVLLEIVSRRRMQYQPAFAFVLSVLIAAVTFAILYRVVWTANKKQLASSSLLEVNE